MHLFQHAVQVEGRRLLTRLALGERLNLFGHQRLYRHFVTERNVAPFDTSIRESWKQRSHEWIRCGPLD